MVLGKAGVCAVDAPSGSAGELILKCIPNEHELEPTVDSSRMFLHVNLFLFQGGRDLKGTASNPKNLRTAPQSKDQCLSRGNQALKTSSETGFPIRVIRGYKSDSVFAPEEGYRYDGRCQLFTPLYSYVPTCYQHPRSLHIRLP